MSDILLRHLIALIGTLVCFLAFLAGYISGQHGWWWSAIILIIIYALIFKYVDE